MLIVGAGATGLTLACDLKRRGLAVRIIDAAEGGFVGSRAKGLQPRSLEVFDDLGVINRLKSRSTLYPPLGLHFGPVTIKRTMIKLHTASADIPYPNTFLTPQYETDQSLRERLVELGGTVEQSKRLSFFTQRNAVVEAIFEVGGGDFEAIRARYMVGADGASSSVRRGLGIAFAGTTDDSDRMIVADITASGISRNRWHIWPRFRGRFTALCPLPNGRFQLMHKLGRRDAINLSPAEIDQTVRTHFRGSRIRVHDVHWSSIWRPNTRLASHYRVDQVLLAGDAAHVHPLTGGQGLNMGVQDAYNLGWKLGQVLAGANDSLLESYEAERRPVAARVLHLATGLYADLSKNPLVAMKRGDDERQLTLSYRHGPLGSDSTAPGLLPGDRAADAPVTLTSGASTTLFDLFRGPWFTALTLGTAATTAFQQARWPESGAAVKCVALDAANNTQFRAIYGLNSEAAILVRPDGYIIARTSGNPRNIATWPTLPLFPAPAPAV